MEFGDPHEPAAHPHPGCIVAEHRLCREVSGSRHGLRLDVPTLGVDDFEELGVVEFKSPIPVHAVCPAGFEKVDVHQSFWNDFFRLISVGLYRPAKTVVTCRSGARYMIGLNHQGLVEVLKQVKHAAEEGMAALPGASQTPN